MLASYKWLTKIAGFTPEPNVLADKFTFSGLEVDDLVHRGPDFVNMVVAEVLEKAPHPKKDKLSLVKIDAGNETVSVVCGAPNCPGPGGQVVLAKIGAVFGEITIAPRKLAGEDSNGMLCSEAELNIGPEDDGILILTGITDAPNGTPIAEALDLEDWIYELGVTPNRPDALSHQGLAREMCLLFDQPAPTRPTTEVKEAGPAADEMIAIALQNPKGCPRYAAAIVTGVKVGPSPFPLRYRLHNLGIRPISNLVDITNSILLEYGQPLHAFDLDKIAGKKIVVRNASDGEKMKTLDGIDRTFSSDDLLICDGEKPIAVAGVMGGQESEISDQTTSILIESAYFNPSGIRRTSKKLKLSSESSYRFERGIDPNQTASVLQETTLMVETLAGGTKAPGIIDSYPAPIQPLKVTLRPSRYEKLMGHSVGIDEMKKIIEGIGALATISGENLVVDVPTSRPDIEREVDLIEEVARIDGMDKIPAVLPRIQCTIPDRTEFEAIKRTKEILVSLGLEESVSYSFVPTTMLAQLEKADGIVHIANPLSSTRSAMRTTLLAGLLENLKRAESRYIQRVAQFEVGRVFHDNPGNELPTETVRAAALLSGPRHGWISEDNGVLDFYDAKGLVVELSEELTGITPSFQPIETIPHLHPNRSCTIMVDGMGIGTLGEIHPSVLSSLKLRNGVVCFELDLLSLHSKKAKTQAFPLSHFPPMGRDVAFLVNDNLDAGPVEEALKKACGELVTDVKLFDIYRGKGIAEDMKSLAFSIQYRSFERTLTDDEIDAIHNGAIKEVCAQFSITTR